MSPRVATTSSAIPNLETPAELETHWRKHEGVHVLVEDNDKKELVALLPDARLVYEGKIGSRKNRIGEACDLVLTADE